MNENFVAIPTTRQHHPNAHLVIFNTPSVTMSLSPDETQQLLQRLIFTDGTAEDWVQDVWALSPTLGETAARLVDVLQGLMDSTSTEKLENLLQGYYQEQFED